MADNYVTTYEQLPEQAQQSSAFGDVSSERTQQPTDALLTDPIATENLCLRQIIEELADKLYLFVDLRKQRIERSGITFEKYEKIQEICRASFNGASTL